MGWQWHQLDRLQARCFSCCPTNSVSTEGPWKPIPLLPRCSFPELVEDDLMWNQVTEVYLEKIEAWVVVVMIYTLLSYIILHYQDLFSINSSSKYTVIGSHFGILVTNRLTYFQEKRFLNWREWFNRNSHTCLCTQTEYIWKHSWKNYKILITFHEFREMSCLLLVTDVIIYSTHQCTLLSVLIRICSSFFHRLLIH